MKFQGKEQCWERMGCGQGRVQSCPAYPDYGRLCWPVAGTKCPTGARGEHARKIKADRASARRLACSRQAAHPRFLVIPR